MNLSEIPTIFSLRDSPLICNSILFSSSQEGGKEGRTELRPCCSLRTPISLISRTGCFN